MSLILEITLYFWSAIIAIICILMLKQIMHCRNVYTIFKRNGIPGPTPRLFVGNFFQMHANKDPNNIIDQWLKKYGNVFGFFFGSEPHLIINDVEIIKEIMIRQFRMFRNRAPLSIPVKPICDSILSAEGDQWKSMRKVLTPAFSSSKIKLMSTSMNQSVDTFMKEITSLAERNEDFDIYERVQALTLDVIGRCALALDLNCQRNLNDSFLNSVREYLKFSANVAVTTAVFFPFLGKVLRFVNDNLTAGKMTDTIVDNLQRVIEERRQNKQKCRIDLLQLLLDAADESNKENCGSKYQVDDHNTVANSHLFLLAGYETTSTALAYTCYLLAKHQDIQDRVYNEITANVKNFNEPSYEDVMSLQYLDQVWNESLRYYPPVTLFITRVCYEDCEINGVKIPKGVVIQLPVNHIHHDPQHYPDPWKFDPDRFSVENKANLNPSAFMPFGLGPRNCIGMRFALFEAKLALARLLHKFHLEFAKDTDNTLEIICPTVLSTPEKGVNLRAAFR